MVWPDSPQAFQGEVVTNEEFIFRHADGNQIMVEAGASPVYNKNNQIIAVAVVFHDITERKQAEKALRESEAQKAAILDGITTNLAFVNENLEVL
jgi:PAS domain-containing protein